MWRCKYCKTFLYVIRQTQGGAVPEGQVSFVPGGDHWEFGWTYEGSPQAVAPYEDSTRLTVPLLGNGLYTFTARKDSVHTVQERFYVFYDFMDSPDRNVAYKRLRKFILATQASKLKEFNTTLTMLANWSKYILNAFDCPYSNGFTEGTNNKIKVIKRNAYGFRNFENFRNRILMTSI